MPQLLIHEAERRISVPIPLTANSGKIRIKTRSQLNEYGLIFATRQNPFSDESYAEWMIGYDVVVSNAERFSLTTLPELQFQGANGATKALYELSEIICYFSQWGIITPEQLACLAEDLGRTSADQLLDQNQQLKICRDEFSPQQINGINFNFTLVKYPLLVKQFDNSDIIVEIKITEQQRAMAVQPMLYVCLPVSELQSPAGALIGRTAQTNELAHFDVTPGNIGIFLEILKLFGLLSESHRHDVLQIINTVRQSL